MKFGVREVMVVAALTFGIVAAGCSSSFRPNLAMDPHLRAMNAGGSDTRVCFSKYEFEFYYPDGVPVREEVVPQKVIVEPVEEPPVAGGSAPADAQTCPVTRSWSPVLPAFFK